MVDEVLVAALTVQGATGVRALGLIRDTARVLAGAGLERSAEVAESCLRGAADALLRLPGAPGAVGLRSAATDLLAAVDALPDPPARPAAGDPTAGGPPGRAPDPSAGVLGHVRVAAEVLRGQLASPGGFHRARAAGIAGRLMGVVPGSAQERALHVYREVLLLARELLVPLPGRAARVLELAALTAPGAGEARELAAWADPRAAAFFFGSGPAAAWLDVFQDRAPHLLLADEAAGLWPAAPFLEHLAATTPQAVALWLAGHAAGLAVGRPRRSGRGAAPGRRRGPGPGRGEAVTPAGPGSGPCGGDGRSGGQGAPVDGQLGGEPLDGRAGRGLAGRRRGAAEGRGRPHSRRLPGLPGRAHADRRPLPELTEVLHREWAARLPEHDIAGLLRELVVTVHAAGGGLFRWARAVCGALAGLLRRDIEAPGTYPWPEFVDLDEVRVLDAEFFLGPVLDVGPLLARAVLDLAAADAAAGLPLGERLRAWPRIEQADPALHDRVLAAHLAAHPPAAGTDAAATEEWWDRAVEVTVRLPVGLPTPEGARLVALVLDTCPPGRADGLQRRARAALGTAPSAAEVDRLLPDGTDQAERAGGAVEPLAFWLRVWAWSPVLPAQLLASFAPLLAALRRVSPDGPSDPRAAARPRSRHDTVIALENLRGPAAAAGPLAVAAALVGAPDAGADGYAFVLQRMVGADPAAWTADVPAALTRPDLNAYYLAAVTTAAPRPGAFPAGPAGAVHAALALSRALPAPADPHVPDAAEYASRAWSGLLALVWRTGGDLGGDLPAVLDRLHTIAAPLTRPAAPPPAEAATSAAGLAGLAGLADPPGPRPAGEEEELPACLMDTHPAVLALDCLLDYAAGRATRDGAMPGDVLDLVADVLAARPDDEAVAAVIGAHLPLLHRRATAFTAAHHPELYALVPGRPSPAAAWLRVDRGSSLDPLLLADLDRGQLLAPLREEPSGGTAFRVVHALLTGDTDLLGDPVAVWRELAAGPGGADTASDFLGHLALFTAMSPADRTAAPTERMWWTAALDADLAPGALAGAGYFAGSLPDEMWLPLARRSAAHTPAQADAERVAERAARHPREPDALLLVAYLLTRPAPEGVHDANIRRHARALLQAAEALPAPDRPAGAEQLRQALVEAGEVDLVPAPAG